jgi:hypothetical protein
MPHVPVISTLNKTYLIWFDLKTHLLGLF